MRRLWSIRSYLVTLLIAATAPLLLLQIYFIDRQIDRDVAVAESTAAELAAISAHNVSSFLSECRRLITQIAERPKIKALDFQPPDPFLLDFFDISEQFANVVVFDKAGEVLFSAVPLSPGESVRVDDVQWFQEVNRREDFVVGDPRVGRITDRWVSVLAYPIRNSSGEMIAALGLPVDLVRLQRLFHRSLPEGSVLTVVDRLGRIISRSADPEKWVGRRIDQERLSDGTQVSAQDTDKIVGLDDAERIYGTATVQGPDWQVYLGIPSEVAMESSRRVLRNSLLVSSLALALAASFALFVSRRINRPIDELAEYCRTAGSTGQPPPRIHGPAEIEEMTDAIEEMVERRSNFIRKLEESRAWLGLAVRSAQIGLWERGLEDETVRYSREWKAQLGYQDDEIADKQEEFESRLHPEDRKRLLELIDQVVADPSVSWTTGEFRLRHKDGTFRWFLSQATLVRNERGLPSRFLGAHIDITERKAFEEKLQRSSERFEIVARATNDAIWDWDIVRDEISWHNHSQTLFGYPKANSIWKSDHWFRLIHPGDRRRIKAAIDRLIAGSDRSWSDEYRLQIGPSVYVHIYDRAHVIRDGQGLALRMIGAKQDITNRKKTEQALSKAKRRLEKLSLTIIQAEETERRRIARELHDEIGQTLTATKINLEALQRFPEPALLARRLRDSIGLVDQAIAASRDLSLRLRPPMLDDLGLKPSLQWLARQLAERSGLELELLLPDTLDRCDPEIETACFRVAQEALTNVNRHAAASKVVVQLSSEAGMLTLTVQDDGVGFDVEAKRSTAERGRSFGLLGMEERTSLVGGRIAWRSRPNRGTEVVARFPVSPREYEAPQTSELTT